MALNKDILGQALFNKRKEFCDKTIDELIAEHGTLDGARLAMCKADADEIIKHIKDAGEVRVPALGLIAPSGGGAVTGNANTGKMV